MFFPKFLVFAPNQFRDETLLLLIAPMSRPHVTCILFCHSLSRIVGFNVSFKLTNPITPATNDEIKITNFALLIIVSLSKARSVIKIDIVNPMPPKKPTPKIDFQFMSSGSLQSPNVTAKNVNRKMPLILFYFLNGIGLAAMQVMLIR